MRRLSAVNFGGRVAAILLPVILAATVATTTVAAQQKPVVQGHPSAPAGVSEKDSAAEQEQLIRLLKLSPTLTTVVARDPSLLANQDYVRRNNPELAQYLEGHPEIAANPDFYLFTHLEGDGRREEALERAVWPALTPAPQGRSAVEVIFNDLGPMLVFLCVLAALIWLIRTFVENRRWSRMLKLQTEVHGKLIERLSSNQELLAYMETEAGRRFLEAAPIPVGFEAEQRVPSAVARVLTPLQIGIVLSLLGAGFLFIRHSQIEMEIPFLILGTLFLMPGVGFILSAGITWILAGRLGMMPASSEATRIQRDRL
jgi:hypothetical protein